MVEVGIIGGGFWGSAVAYKLEELGISHVVIDDHSPLGASRSAAGICKLDWYRQDTVKKMMDGVFTYDDFLAGFAWLKTLVKVDHVPETFLNVHDGTSATHKDNYLAIPEEFLCDTYRARVEEIVTHDIGVGVRTDLHDFSFDQIIVCAGVNTDNILEAAGLGRPTGVVGLLGRAITFDCDGYDETPRCQTAMIRPYVHYTFRHFNGRIRGGDTVERKRDDKRLSSLIDTATNHYTGIREVRSIAGVRPVCKRMFVGRVHPRVIAATGGHRVGFGLAGAVAERVASLL